jgi:hypothetical protein
VATRLFSFGDDVKHALPLPRVIAHCDWSIHPGKRWMAVALQDGTGAGAGTGWQIGLPEPVGVTATFLDRLAARSKAPGPVLVGVDFPIGVPAAYGAATGLANFAELLAVVGSGAWERWFDVCDDRADIDIHRPFYPVRPGGRRREHLLTGLGHADAADLLRACERKTDQRPAACSLFWTLGGNQVGKAALAGWREVLQPQGGRIALWPFDGALHDLLEGVRTIVAETYPGDTYHRLGIGRRPVWSKRSQAGRASVAPPLLDWLAQRGHAQAPGLADAIRDGFGTHASGEDQFDALIGLCGMLDVVEGHRAEGPPLDAQVGRWEGWVLGQAA